MAYTTVFFDLDDTLYPNQTGLWQAIRDRMRHYMVEMLGLPPEEVPDIQRTFFQTYGTTLRGLQNHYQVDADQYVAYVHDLPLEQYLRPNPALRGMLLSLPQKRCHLHKCRCGSRRCVCCARLVWKAVLKWSSISRRWVGPANPSRNLTWRALALSGSPDPQDCVLVDDALRNLQPAGEMGFTTVLVENGAPVDAPCRFAVDSLLELPDVLPGLWDEKGSMKKEITMQTAVGWVENMSPWRWEGRHSTGVRSPLCVR